MRRLVIGVSGWSYDTWYGTFYPEDLPRKRRLEHLSRRLPATEVNGSFYGLLRPATYESYRESTPPGFLLAVKGSRFITHSKKLSDVDTPLANFFASGVLRLEDKLGPILWQLPDMEIPTERIASFLGRLPSDTEEASTLARRHDDRLKARASLAVDRRRRIRHAMEVRHESHFTAEVVRLARDAGIALAFSHSGDWRLIEELTAGFVYLRLHGAPRTYASGYGPKAIDAWAGRIRAWADGDEPDDAARITDRTPPRREHRDVYVFFDNDSESYAPRDALRLMEALGVDWSPGE